MLRYISYLPQGTANKMDSRCQKSKEHWQLLWELCPSEPVSEQPVLLWLWLGEWSLHSFHSSLGKGELLHRDWPSVSPWDTTNQTWGRTGPKLFLLSQDHTLLEIALSQHRSVSCCSNSAMNESLSFESYAFVSSLRCLGLLLCWGLSLQKNRAWKNEPFSAAMKLGFKKCFPLYIHLYINWFQCS